MREGSRIAYVGPDVPELRIWHGQPGIVVDLGCGPHEVSASFVNGPSLGLPPEEVVEIDDDTYRGRLQRVLALGHPTGLGRSIPQFWLSLEPWPEDVDDLADL